MTDWRALSPPAPSRVRSARPATLYGVALLLLVVSVVTGALLYSYFYLAINADQWPPDGVGPAPWWPYALSVGLTLAAAGGSSWAYRVAERLDRHVAAAAASALAVVAGLAAAAAMAVALAGEPLAADAHAYAAIVTTLGGLVITLLLVGSISTAVVIPWVLFGHAGTGVADPPRVMRAYWVTVGLIAALVAGVVVAGARWL